MPLARLAMGMLGWRRGRRGWERRARSRLGGPLRGLGICRVCGLEGVVDREGALRIRVSFRYVLRSDEAARANMCGCVAALDEETLMGSYVPVDDDGRIRFDPDAPGNSVRRQTRYSETVRCPQMSSIRYHAPSHKMLLTSREPDAECTMCMFSPPLSEPEDGQGGHWMLGEGMFDATTNPFSATRRGLPPVNA